jgi:phage shock protein PspC (stress-responsive transcriptional regulator)
VVVILAQEAVGITYPLVRMALVYCVLVTTVGSGAHYLWAWIIMKRIEPDKHGHGPHV